MKEDVVLLFLSKGCFACIWKGYDALEKVIRLLPDNPFIMFLDVSLYSLSKIVLHLSKIMYLLVKPIYNVEFFFTFLVGGYIYICLVAAV